MNGVRQRTRPGGRPHRGLHRRPARRPRDGARRRLLVPAQRATQSAADAAALAGAQELPESPGSGSASRSRTPEHERGRRRRSRSRASTSPTTRSRSRSRARHGVFAKIFGINSVDVHARRVRAQAGSTRSGAPIAVDRAHPLLNCKPCPASATQTTLDLKTKYGTFRLLNLDRTQGGTGGKIDAEWILRGYNGFMPLGWYGSDPGAAFNDKIKEALNIRIGTSCSSPSTTRSREKGRTSSTASSAGSASSSPTSRPRGTVARSTVTSSA